MDHLNSSGSAVDCRFQDAPFADERNRYLHHCETHGAKPSALKVKRNELMWIARRLDPDANRGVGMKELMAIALERRVFAVRPPLPGGSLISGDHGCDFSLVA